VYLYRLIFLPRLYMPVFAMMHRNWHSGSGEKLKICINMFSVFIIRKFTNRTGGTNSKTPAFNAGGLEF